MRRDHNNFVTPVIVPNIPSSVVCSTRTHISFYARACPYAVSAFNGKRAASVLQATSTTGALQLAALAGEDC